MLSPFDYGQLVGATLLGYLIWGDFPDGWSWLGVGIIICSGIYIAHREAVHQPRQAAPSAEAEAEPRAAD